MGSVPDIPDPDPGVKTVRCTSVAQIREIFRGGMQEPLTLILADGEYDITYWNYGFRSTGNGQYFYIPHDNSSIIGESKDPTKVIIKDKGFNHGYSELIQVEGNNITLAYFTIKDCRGNAIKVQNSVNNLTVHNVHIEDCAERSIKVPKGDTLNPIISSNVKIQYCVFEQFTPIHRDRSRLWNMGGDYIAGMDVMGAVDWHVHHNIFNNIRGMTGGGRGALFFWNTGRRITAERNFIYKCDRAIAFGNPSTAGMDKIKAEFHVDSSIIKNNMIVQGAWYAVEICSSTALKLYNNTIYNDSAGDEAVHLYRNTSSIEMKNNIIYGNFRLRYGEMADTSHNLMITGPGQEPAVLFNDALNNDFHLKMDATAAINQGLVLSEVTTDWDGQPRDSLPDLGADEYSTANRVITKSKQPDLILRIFPNPFNHSTRISLNIPEGTAEISIYDISGKLLKKFDRIKPGPVRWNAGEQPQGIYFVKINVGKMSFSRKICLIK
jgi:hypothetical protein